MAKDKITDYSATAADNTDVGGVGIVGSVNTISNLDNAIREVMSHLAETNAGTYPLADTLTLADPADLTKRGRLDMGNVTAGQTRVYSMPDFTGTVLAINTTTGAISATWADDGAGLGPTLTLDRNSASPATNDALGYIVFSGRDSGGATQTYADMFVQATDVTAATEDALFAIRTVVNGSMTNQMVLGPTSLTAGSVLREVDGSASAPAYSFTNDTDCGMFRATTNEIGFATAGSEWARFASAGAFHIGKTSTALSTAGVSFFQTGQSHHTRDNDLVAQFNRLTAGGTILDFLIASVSQGSVSGTGTTIAYNTFCGAHWSQLSDLSTPEIPIGTICEHIDEKCEWYGIEYVDGAGNTVVRETDRDGKKLGSRIEREIDGVTVSGKLVLLENDQLAKFKVSDTPGSKRVYAVFMAWEGNTATLAGLGAFVIRIGKGEKVQGGDLIESAGDGTGRVIPEDSPYTAVQLQKRHVATITAAVPLREYDDGSKLYPCTLHCG